MYRLNSVPLAAALVGVSTRHLRRISEDAKIEPVPLGDMQKFFYTADQIEQLRQYQKSRKKTA